MADLSLRSLAATSFIALATGIAACQGGTKLILSDVATASGGAGGNATTDGAGGSAGTCAKTSCGDACVDTATDSGNCGACGKACAEGESCVEGACSLVCGGGTTPCVGAMGAECADTAIDPDNCGACGKACAEGELCDKGACVTACGSGTMACGKSCIDIHHNPKHCGGCDKPCPGAANAKPYCVDDACGVACLEGFDDCNSDPSDGCETPLDTVDNCGSCNKKCALLNATPACVGGACLVKTCDANFADCDKDGKSCETNIATDTNNCGACGKKCGANESCVNQVCKQVGCQKGAVEMSVSPGGDMKVCDDPTNTTCEQDVETLCPSGWQLCSFEQYTNRNAGWTYSIGGATVVVAEIYCRNGGGAGHYTLGPYGGSVLGDDVPLNCGYGSSRESCVTGYGCNETNVQALCCAPTPSCGNGMVDSVEEGCDDKNLIETDDCLNNCTKRQPPGCN